MPGFGQASSLMNLPFLPSFSARAISSFILRLTASFRGMSLHSSMFSMILLLHGSGTEGSSRILSAGAIGGIVFLLRAHPDPFLRQQLGGWVVKVQQPIRILLADTERRIGGDRCDIIVDVSYEAPRAHHIEHFPDGGKGCPERLIVFLGPSSLPRPIACVESRHFGEKDRQNSRRKSSRGET